MAKVTTEYVTVRVKGLQAAFVIAGTAGFVLGMIFMLVLMSSI